MESLIETIRKLSLLPMARQLSLLVGLAVSIAAGVGIVLWSQDEEYSVLYSELAESEASLVVDSLERLGVQYRLDGRTGLISVPNEKKHELRLKLASEGLPSKRGGGFEILYSEQQLGTSSFMEKARFNRALEEELAASIATLDNVRSARVHLAIPKRSTFIRSQSKANASVLVELKPGRVLNDDQSAGIVYMVASSVPALEPDGVTLVDQKGNLLSNQGTSKELMRGTEQFRFARAVEENLVNSVEGILEPILGDGRVQAKVVADLNFTTLEKTVEQYDPGSLSLRSEQTVNEAGGAIVAVGAPDLPDQNIGDADAGGRTDERTVKATRNYEMDHSISHIKESPGSIRRISVAVVVDYKSQVLEDGSVERTAMSDKEIDEIRVLVKEAVGFNEARGDSVSITNAPFMEIVTDFAEIPETPLWEQTWVQGMVKQVIGFIGVLVLVLGVVRPLLKNMTQYADHSSAPAMAIGGGGVAGVGGDAGSAVGGLPTGQASAAPPGAPDNESYMTSDYGRQLAGARNLVEEDPTRVAQVIRGWVAEDG